MEPSYTRFDFTEIAKMLFSSLIETAKNSPFKAPVSQVACEKATVSDNSKALVPSRNVQAFSAAAQEVEFGSTKYFVLCGLGGILSCGKFSTWFTFD